MTAGKWVFAPANLGKAVVLHNAAKAGLGVAVGPEECARALQTFDLCEIIQLYEIDERGRTTMIACVSNLTESDYAALASAFRRFAKLFERPTTPGSQSYYSHWDEQRQSARLGVKQEELLKLAPSSRRFERAEARVLRLCRTYFNASKVDARNLPWVAGVKS